jgi:hypothetical protein
VTILARDLRWRSTPEEKAALHNEAGTRLVCVKNLTRMCYTVAANSIHMHVMHASLVLNLDQYLVYVDVECSRCSSPIGVTTTTIATCSGTCMLLPAVRLDLCHSRICITLFPYGGPAFTSCQCFDDQDPLLGELDLQKDRPCRLSPR